MARTHADTPRCETTGPVGDSPAAAGLAAIRNNCPYRITPTEFTDGDHHRYQSAECETQCVSGAPDNGDHRITRARIEEMTRAARVRAIRTAEESQ